MKPPQVALPFGTLILLISAASLVGLTSCGTPDIEHGVGAPVPQAAYQSGVSVNQEAAVPGEAVSR